MFCRVPYLWSAILTSDPSATSFPWTPSPLPARPLVSKATLGEEVWGLGRPTGTPSGPATRNSAPTVGFVTVRPARDLYGDDGLQIGL